jgi:hypothetical protein
MAPLHPAVALTALTDVDVELPVDGLARDLDLELLSDMGFVEWPAAVGAAFGQGRLVDLVDLLRAGPLAVGLGAVVLARLAPGSLGVRFGLALGEGSCLALAGTEGRVELVPQAVILGLQVIDPPLEGLTVGTPDRFHARIIRSSPRCSGGGGSRRMVQVELGALIKYLFSFSREQQELCLRQLLRRGRILVGAG